MGPTCNASVLTGGRREVREERRCRAPGLEDRGAASQGCSTSRGWKKQEDGFASRSSRRMQPADHFRLLTSDDTLVLFQVTKFVVIVTTAVGNRTEEKTADLGGKLPKEMIRLGS